MEIGRRRFLTLLGLAPVAIAAPKVTYSFLGGILRPRPKMISWTVGPFDWEPIHDVYIRDWRYIVRVSNIDRSLLVGNYEYILPVDTIKVRRIAQT